MPKIDFTSIIKALPSPGGTLPVNIVLVQNVPGTGDPNAAERPVQIRSMKDVADLAKPGFSVVLLDENGQPVQCTVDYSEGVVSTDDLTAHLNPDWVHEHMRDTQKKALNVQQRLRARQEVVARLHAYLMQRPGTIAKLRDLITELTNDRERLKKQLETLRNLDLEEGT